MSSNLTAILNWGFGCHIGDFYICDGSRVEFIGCCISDPCADDAGICPGDQLRNAYSPVESLGNLPTHNCDDAHGDNLWYACPLALSTWPFSYEPVSGQDVPSIAQSSAGTLPEPNILFSETALSVLANWHGGLRRLHSLGVGGFIEWLWDALLTLAPICFISLALLILRLDGQAISPHGQSLHEMARLSPTVYPILCAAIASRFFKNLARCWLEQPNGIGLAVLEQIFGSQSFTGAFERLILVKTQIPTGIIILFMWTLSPLGGQAASRMLAQRILFKSGDAHFASLLGVELEGFEYVHRQSQYDFTVETSYFDFDCRIVGSSILLENYTNYISHGEMDLTSVFNWRDDSNFSSVASHFSYPAIPHSISYEDWKKLNMTPTWTFLYASLQNWAGFIFFNCTMEPVVLETEINCMANMGKCQYDELLKASYYCFQYILVRYVSPTTHTSRDMESIPDEAKQESYRYYGYMNATRAKTTAKYDVYRADRLWITVVLTTTFVLQMIAILGLAMRVLIHGPDILGFPSSITRDSPYMPLLSGGSGLSGPERAKMLRHIRVQLTDVRPDDDIGYVAVIAVPSTDPAEGGTRREKTVFKTQIFMRERLYM
ncbi:hypothetical protein EDB81DRAFT_764164 [Dactylonectria macrodidyma]|uniref:Uncharacterized protein n=1 Tax=Dactylonectria macrodidyma TaxID=307937 RepID=A0A9P9IQQ5_9HYPO|nr:hypothetical protein EDB81DRAFT_764164 [Dactylonectria macrodidyma]